MPQQHAPAITVVVKPNARLQAITLEDGTVVVRVREPAHEGKANDACRRALARALGVAPSRLRLTRGHRAKVKVFAVLSLTAADLAARVARLAG
ncbi:MAG: DUF167 domain-containing protein [Candidatus Eremiobacteraeota bacterium]|nr:DUF167 domain-containing protein [Candidatus Eremiobacteraeota bacterium]